MVNRDRSHPSVLVWSLGNENTSQARASASRATCARRRALARQLDPTRLVGLAFPGYPTVGKQQLYTELDALGRERLLRLVSGPAGLDRRPRRARRRTWSGCTTTTARQALFVTEFGAEANRAGPGHREGHLRLPAGLPDLPPGRFRPEAVPERGAGLDPARFPGQTRVRRREPAVPPRPTTPRDWSTQAGNREAGLRHRQASFSRRQPQITRGRNATLHREARVRLVVDAATERRDAEMGLEL